MAKLLSIALAAFLWLLALVDAQGAPKDDSAPAEVLGNGFSPASPLFARGMLDTRQITVAAVKLDGVVALPNVAPGARTAAVVAAASTQAASVVGVAPHALLVTTDTTTITRGRESTTTTTRTVPVEGEPSGFSCPPMTVTNSLGDSLELGNNCVLKYSPAKPTTTSEAAIALRISQEDCPPTRTTSTVYTTEGTGGLVTVTATVTGENSAPPGFACTPMTVTNVVGDEFAIDDKCAVQLTVAGPKAISKPGAAGTVDIFVSACSGVLGSIFTILIGLYI
ncbi:hypothetical protein AJ78_04384 [Emergomyces pasteurianus Ep9510]|uniref:Ubiquitin 3 binding protein But2 C-terminal domain-containing protein n=1 Tax=Emergomyces pasteurianus Ep9510 TaxID=1447872 RepID=A0A1J9Q547_9EURO|nr:hypothetical protein AJ78_04384 [Emergomyces pasteurianus Ep9510]